MNGYQTRTETKKKIIKECASKLFERHGFDKVSLEEIAEKAHVSRVTIYKYFKNKYNLRNEILKDIALAAAWEIENIIAGNKSFSSKAAEIILLKTNISLFTNGDFIGTSIGSGGELGKIISPELKDRIDCMIESLIQQGREEGLVGREVTAESLHNYFKILRAGLRQLYDTDDPLLSNREELLDLTSLFIYGLRGEASRSGKPGAGE